jgi:pseudouridine synthase
MQQRVQKFLSEAGIASRRKAEEFIKSGQVSINGHRAKLGDKVDPERDTIKVYGKIIQPTAVKIYIALNKPKGYVTSKRDPLGRKTVFSLLPEDIRTKIWNVGRLDFETEGLLLLTNDGDLTQELAHPKYEHEKEYEVITNDTLTKEQIKELSEGVMIASGLTSPAHVKAKSNKAYLTIHEGKKRQVRRMFQQTGYTVKSLKRVRIMTLADDTMRPGAVRMLTQEEKDRLLRSVAL